MTKLGDIDPDDVTDEPGTLHRGDKITKEDGSVEIVYTDLPGTVAVHRQDQRQRQRHDAWLAERGLPAFYAEHPTTVQRWITEEQS